MNRFLSRSGRALRAAWILKRALAGRRDGALLQIENTNHCNFRCSYCPTHSKESMDGRPARGHMTMERFEEILDASPRARIVVLQGQGEPLLDPTLFEKIALARGRGLLTQVISNASMLDVTRSERLAREGPDLLLFSLDAVSPEKNEELRAGLRYEKVARSIRSLSRARRRPMVLGLLSIVHGAFDEEVERALVGWNELEIDVLLYKPLNRAFANRIHGYRAERTTRVPRSLRARLDYVVLHQRVATVKPCAQVRFDWPYHLWDGTKTACCILNHPRHGEARWTRESLLARFRERRLPRECESCSFFGGYT